MTRQQAEIEIANSPANVLENIIETARHGMSRVVLQDVTMTKLTYRRMLAGVDVLARQWESLIPITPDNRVALLLPNTNAMPLTLLSLWSAGRVPAILNYSTGVPAMLVCAQISKINYVISSKTFLQKAKIDVAPLISAGLKFFYLEDIREGISSAERLLSLLHVTTNPSNAHHTSRPPETAVILFTSGSEGPPKAVELTHANLLANIRQMLSVIDLNEADRICNALPLFHSFGLAIGLLLPLVRGGYSFLYPSPLHYRVVPTLIYEFNCTVFFGTNTFLNGYGRKAHPYDFRSLRYLFAGAEKLQQATADLWSRRFGVRVLEGYGATECSPCVAANTPLNPKFGSAGRLLPLIEYRLEPVEGVAEGGRLWLRGPNIMRGYVNPDANAKFKAGAGWYDTGDIARVDEAGFLYILGRMKRFAKISGEMVSLTAVEEAFAGAFPQYGLRMEIAILSRPDAERGEALVAVANDSRLKLEDLRPVLKAKGLSNLCMPRELKFVHDIPKLGTGKVNHRELQKSLFGA
jgi:acyl-[acyl-carrier-protein]-phospholipid O-acyltransferase/long-chain-fatty-acid--[acyl-carrier-protein] ligase